MRKSANIFSGVVMALIGVLFAPPALSEQSAQPDFYIQVFALSGPVCPVVRPDVDCPDALLPGAALRLQRLHRKSGSWRDVRSFETNARGYATLLVHRRGLYRVTVPPEEPSPLPRPMAYPLFEGEVSFNVPARHFGPANYARLTPVVVLFDSGIR